MKKITFLVAFLSFGAFAQTFPSPYCSITEYEDVELITSVNFAGTTITNTNATSPLVNFVSTVANVVAGNSYTIQVKGSSEGDFDNEYVAFVDWNRNNILDDAGESFYIGLLSNTTGYDATTASVSITVPSTALIGNTRIRILKVYTDQSDFYFLNSDPCSITSEDVLFEEFVPSYGQALDFTLNVTSLGVNSFDKNLLSIYPNPVKDVLNVSYKSEISEVKIYNLLGQEVLSKTINSGDFNLNVSNLSTGSYVVKLMATEGQHSFKLIKE